MEYHYDSYYDVECGKWAGVGSFILIAACVILSVIGFTSKQEVQFDEKILYQELVKIGVKYPEIVVAQAKLETGNFTSTYYKERYNLFGFRTSKGYMYFKSWKHACQSYKIWQDKHYKYGKSYYTFLEDINYAEDPEYINKLKKIVKYGY